MQTESTHPEYSFTVGVNEERAEFVIDRLREFNQSQKSALWEHRPQPAAPLQIFALDAVGTILGGLIGRTNEIPGWLEVSILWVDEDMRTQGIGSRLMYLAEQEARRRGCHHARLATGDYQAPDFYRRLDYREYGRLEDCPCGETVYYFCKDLI